MSNWSDKIVVIGVGVSKEDTDKIKEIIVQTTDEWAGCCFRFKNEIRKRILDEGMGNECCC